MSDQSSSRDLEEAIDGPLREITSKEQFLQLLGLLRRDLAENKKAWENQTLEDYLEAMEAFCGSLEHCYQNQKISVDLNNPGWRVFADVLLAARVYE